MSIRSAKLQPPPYPMIKNNNDKNNKPMTTKKHPARALAEALRSGKYKQVRIQLYDTHENQFDENARCMCAEGVACDLYMELNPEAKAYWEDGEFVIPYEPIHADNDIEAPQAVVDYFELTDFINWVRKTHSTMPWVATITDYLERAPRLADINDRTDIGFLGIADLLDEWRDYEERGG